MPPNDDKKKCWSFSRVEGFTTCPRRFYHDLVDPATSVARQRAFDLGSQVHDALEIAGRLVKDGKSWEAVEGFFRQPEHTPPGPLGPNAVLGYVQSVRALLTQCRPAALEARFRDTELRNAGRIDAILETTPVVDRTGCVCDTEPGRCVVDFKTGKHRQNQYSIRFAAQLILYCHETGVRNAAFVYVDDSCPAVVVPVKYSEHDIENGVRWFKAQVAAIEHALPQGMEAFALADPTSPLCSERFCAYFDRCYPKPKEA